jgi:peptidyl-prolyl cis-trans isomerase NIMA-interacting 1
MRAHDDERLWQLDLVRVARPLVIAAACAGMFAASCTDLTEPARARRDEETSAEIAAPSAPPPVPPADVVVAETGRVAANPAEQVEVSHILVSYQGAARARPTVTRTRDEARALAEQLAAKAHEPGADFALLAKSSSDAPSGVEGGALPRFGREQMVKPFSDAAFALRPGEASGVVETNFGFHLIRRAP